MIYSMDAMYRISLLLVVCIGTVFSQNHPSIHQRQLEYYNQHYIFQDESDMVEPILPKRSRNRTPSHEVFGYHPYWMGTSWQNYNFDLISTLAFFSAEANATGELDNLHGWPSASLINEAHSHGTDVVLCVTLFSNSSIVTLLSNSAYRQNLIDNLLYQVQLGNADGVNVDFEAFPASQRDNMVTFITDLTATFHSEIPGSQVTIAMPAVDWNDAWDYDSLAMISDGLFIMGYDYHWSGSSTTGAVSPLSGPGYNLTWTVLDYLNKTNNQTNKLILGIPYYGYEWLATGNYPGAATLGTGTSKTYSEMEAYGLTYGKQWHESSQTPWYYYQDSDWVQGWYDDSLSLSLKYDLALYHNLKGIGMWALGYDGSTNELWDLLYAKFGDAAPPTVPNHFFIKNIGNGSVSIDFQGAETADQFVVLRGYLETVGGLDTLGIYSERPILLNGLTQGETYFLTIAAKNAYGTSGQTEMLGVVPSSEPVSCLIVNGFDRMNGTNNTLDFIRHHGSALLAVGYSFDSASNEAVINENISLNDYQFIDWILGEEGTSTSTFTSVEQNRVESYLENGGYLFVSGSEIGYDLVSQGNNTDVQFYENYLKADYISDAAGEIYSGFGVKNSIFNSISNIMFDNGTHGTYDVDYPDGIKPVGGSEICAKYTNIDYNTRGGMGIQYTGTFGNSNNIGGLLYLSVGFEAIYPESKRDELMTEIMNHYDTQLQIGKNDHLIVPTSLQINRIYPNPFNASVTIEFSIPSSNRQDVSIIITDLLGRTIQQTSMRSNSQKTTWTWDGIDKNGITSPTGIYFVIINNGKQTQSRKITLLK